MSINYVLSAPALNAGGYQMLRDFNFTTLSGVGSAFPGMAFTYHGRLYQVIQNRNGSAIARGDVVSLYYGDTARTGNLQAASTAAVLKTDDTLDTGLAGVRDYPGYVDTTAGVLATTDDMEQHEILTNDATASNSLITIATYQRELGPNFTAATTADALSTTPDATYDYEVFCPWEVVKARQNATTTTIPQGVVVSTTVADDSFGIIQIRGVGIAKVDGTADVATAGAGLAVSNGTAGILELWAPTTTAATLTQLLQGQSVCAFAIGPFTDNATGLRGVVLTMPHAVFPPTSF